MLKLRRLYNKNKMGVWLTVGVIAFFIIILQLINGFVGYKNKEEAKTRETQISNTITNKRNITVQSEKSSVSGEDIDSSEIQSNTEVIEEFINKCNENKVEEAYNMLTDECKEEMYKNINDFKEIYFSKIFQKGKVVTSLQNWYGDIYKVTMEIVGDILSTGKVDDITTIQDYMTVVKKDNEYKLNINNYIGRTQLNRTKEEDEYKIEVISKDTYMDYEKYTIKIKNKTNKDILLDSSSDERSMYIQDTSGVQYASYKHELTRCRFKCNSRG